ncbi:hypothetical protein GGTG_11793 [Gaeumannomyces tritici R3-111a-1]|uniref:Uncharacterized protein n=1 Tax=Gaeumannomyces tritici (strain R3-111a-1) TaxID=644352 RepID=J3PE70_GAET3|nr:hypothetical protein GGTG_11793 [Gaeumannomyces tritici R3-111a-1]EJT70770.1 hypothetical protein GGTG_11793 [Gaeumannomyces tritici R3-111a-1]
MTLVFGTIALDKRYCLPPWAFARAESLGRSDGNMAARSSSELHPCCLGTHADYLSLFEPTLCVPTRRRRPRDTVISTLDVGGDDRRSSPCARVDNSHGRSPSLHRRERLRERSWRFGVAEPTSPLGSLAVKIDLLPRDGSCMRSPTLPSAAISTSWAFFFFTSSVNDSARADTRREEACAFEILLCRQGRRPQGDTRNHPPTVCPLQAIGRTSVGTASPKSRDIGGKRRRQLGGFCVWAGRAPFCSLVQLISLAARPARANGQGDPNGFLFACRRPVCPSRLSLGTRAWAESTVVCQGRDQSCLGIAANRLAAISCQVQLPAGGRYAEADQLRQAKRKKEKGNPTRMPSYVYWQLCCAGGLLVIALPHCGPPTRILHAFCIKHVPKTHKPSFFFSSLAIIASRPVRQRTLANRDPSCFAHSSELSSELLFSVHCSWAKTDTQPCLPAACREPRQEEPYHCAYEKGSAVTGGSLAPSTAPTMPRQLASSASVRFSGWHKGPACGSHFHLIPSSSSVAAPQAQATATPSARGGGGVGQGDSERRARLVCLRRQTMVVWPQRSMAAATTGASWGAVNGRPSGGCYRPRKWSASVPAIGLCLRSTIASRRAPALGQLSPPSTGLKSPSS